jgi:DNA-binding transcriptional ArsR family regulator
MLDFDLNSNDYNILAELFGLLSNAERLRLLTLLHEGDKDVSTLQQAAGISISSVSQHLKSLREAGLVSFRQQGKFRIYRLATPAVADIIARVRRLQLNEAGPAIGSRIGGLSGLLTPVAKLR